MRFNYDRDPSLRVAVNKLELGQGPTVFAKHGDLFCNIAGWSKPIK
jgi:hypothetical protein